MTAGRRTFSPRRRGGAVVALLGCLGGWLGGGLGGCTDASLYRLDDEPSYPDRLTVSGRVCTDDPNRQRFPVRLLLLVDAGAEMAARDPQFRRAAAVEDVIGRYAATPNLSMAVARFGGRPELLTDGFTRSTASLGEAAAGARLPVGCVEGRCRDLTAALGLAEAIVTDDALSAPPGRLVRSRYVVVLLTAGASDPPLAAADGCDEGCRLAADVRDLVETTRGFGAREVVVHALLLRPESDDAAATASAVLEAVTFAGEGTLAVAAAPERLRLLDLPLLPATDALVFRRFVVANTNVLAALGGPLGDSDGDGIADAVEEAEGLDPLAADGDGDGIGDAIERLLAVEGYDPRTPDAPDVCVGVDPRRDGDGDGLGDCEERVLGLEPTLADSDADGLPDGLEFRGGANPWHADALADPDGDGMTNAQEIREHSDPLTSDAQGALDANYRYTFVDEGTQIVPYATGPRDLTGVGVATVGADTPAGTGLLVFDPGPPATLAWQDAGAAQPGPARSIGGAGRYTLVAVDGGGLDRTLTVDVQPAALPAAPLTDAVLVGEAERTCARFTVRNVRLLETRDVGRGPGWNRIRLLFGEVPRDDPGAFPVYRAAELPVRFLAPDVRVPAGVVFLEDRDFVLLGGDE